MKRLPKILFLAFSVVFFAYLLLPSYVFPNFLPGSFQSKEGADTETPLRRAYFTNLTRAEVLDFYQNQLARTSFLNLPLPTLRLNYPPEDAQSLVRDQTHSVYLQEIVHPLRESIFVNGFTYQNQGNTIGYKGGIYKQLVTVKFVPSNYISRIMVGVLILVSIKLLYSEILRLKKNV